MATVYRRGKTWWGRVQRQGREIRQSLKTTTEAVARQRMKAWVDELGRVAWGEKPRRTFDDLALRFIDEHLPRLKPMAARRYLVSIAAMTDSFEGINLDQISSSKIAEFEAARRRGGRRIPEAMKGKRRPKPIAPGTIRRDLACLSSMFGFAIELEWCEVNPVPAYMRRAKKRGLREAAPRRRYLSKEEEAKLLAAAGDRHGSVGLREAIMLAIDTGLRRDELFSMRAPLPSIPGEVGPILRMEKNAVDVTEDTSKNSRARSVPLLPRARGVLTQKPAQIRTSYLILNPETGHRYKALNKGLAGAAKRAGIRPLTWHDLRRTCGCRLLQDHRMSMEQVSRWLGHSSISVTETAYAFLEDEHLQAAITSAQKSAQDSA